MDPVNLRAKFEVRSFTRSWDNSGYLNNFGQSLETPTLPFLHNFECAFVRMDTVNLTAKFEVGSFIRSWENRGYLKTLGSPGYAHATFSPKFLMGICSDGPYECTGHIWSP